MHCFLSIVSKHYFLCIVFHTLYLMHCSPCIGFYALYPMYCFLWVVSYALFSLHCIPCIELFAMYPMHWTRCRHLTKRYKKKNITTIDMYRADITGKKNNYGNSLMVSHREKKHLFATWFPKPSKFSKSVIS